MQTDDVHTMDASFAILDLRSVSYTHLRAHETVLDLVCRLLLEKKKNQQATESILLYVPDSNTDISVVYVHPSA